MSDGDIHRPLHGMRERPQGQMSQPAAFASARASVRLGLVLRSVLVSPRVGFESALTAARRRERVGRRAAEGVTPFVLASTGGASLMLLWLKLSALAEVRSVTGPEYSRALLISALGAGAVLGLVAQLLAAAPSAQAAHTLGGSGRAVDLRIVWGAAALPQVFVLLVLLPLDLLITGPQAFTTDPMVDSVARAWAAVSIALGTSCAVWSLALFLRGVQVATGLGRLRASAVVAVSATVMALVTAAAVAGAAAAAGVL